MGVLFEISIVCHVFCAFLLGLWCWVFGCGPGLLFWGCGWGSGVVGLMFCFGFACLVFWWVGLGDGSLCGTVLLNDSCVWWGCHGVLVVLLCVGVVWFCLESLILAQDERWRRA